MVKDNLVPFDVKTEKLFCGRCGAQCEIHGHLVSQFLMCPTHGEFTIAPVVMLNPDGEWYIHLDDTEQGMWETCKYVDEHGLSGRATRTGE